MILRFDARCSPVVCRRDALIATLLARVDELAVRVAALEVENATLREPPNNGGNYFAFDADTRTLHHGWRAIDA